MDAPTLSTTIFIPPKNEHFLVHKVSYLGITSDSKHNKCIFCLYCDNFGDFIDFQELKIGEIKK